MVKSVDSSKYDCNLHYSPKRPQNCKMLPTLKSRCLLPPNQPEHLERPLAESTGDSWLNEAGAICCESAIADYLFRSSVQACLSYPTLTAIPMQPLCCIVSLSRLNPKPVLCAGDQLPFDQLTCTCACRCHISKLTPCNHPSRCLTHQWQ